MAMNVSELTQPSPCNICRSLSKLTFEVCVGPEEDFNNAAAGALSNYTCQYVQPMGKTSGTVVVPLDISAPNAAYITGQVRLVGYCTADPVPLEKYAAQPTRWCISAARLCAHWC
jgi:hypothetical protein